MPNTTSIAGTGQDGQRTVDLLALADDVALNIERTGLGYRVEVPYNDGLAVFAFDNLESGPAALCADVTGAVWGPEIAATRRFKGRVNLRDLHSESHYRHQLEAMYGPGLVPIFNAACQGVVEAVAEEDLSVDLGAVEATTEVQYVAPPLILGRGPSVLFGDGGTGKTYVALYAAVCVVKGIRFLGQPTQRGPVLYVDYESNEEEAKARLLRILAGLGEEWDDSMSGFIYWPAKGRPLAQMLSALERKVRNVNARCMIVDSAGLACGGSPSDEDVALRFFNCLPRLEIPVLIIAHVTKQSNADKYPYGSVFWSDSPRATWNIKASSSPTLPNILQLTLTRRKANEEAGTQTMAVTMAFRGHEAVKFGVDETVSESAAAWRDIDRILAELVSGPKSTKQLAKALDVELSQIRTDCHRAPLVWKIDNRGSDGSAVWALVG